ncbi:type 1 fimbrial protein [Leclercia adecarboxylata]|uniref:fimbrial protein n=1 Tax=Leclercia adecarboxylata TaxID=83655 RepID=UPI002DB9D6F5|nr:fimbrial protein [Leclercia adecarboxylata]MEB6377625.1 type 1 fimbrial protein [Leclercia adecarboxylata]
MKSKTKILFSGAILSLCFTGISAHANTVNFSGKIISETCQIADNSGNVNVNFGTVNMDALKSHEQTTAQTPFKIHLKGCPTAQNVSISLEGTPDTHANGKADGVLAMNAGDGVAQGVGIEVYSSDDGSTQGTQLTFDRQVKTDTKQADDNGDITFGFLADLKSDSSVDVTAGNINATANIDINYE